MPCIIGMTTGLSRTAAQAKETQLANQFGCQSHHGGNDPDRPSSWAVYGFEHSNY